MVRQFPVIFDKFTKDTKKKTSLLYRVLGVLTCSRALCVCVLACSRAWRAYVLACLRDYLLGVLMCLRAWCVCVCACVLVMMKCFIFLRTCCAFLSYLLYISTLKFKNSHSKKIVCFVKLKIFLIYILIPTKAISIFYSLYIHLLH